MKTTRTVVTVGLVLFTLVVAGCSHKVDLWVTNATMDTLPVSVSARGLVSKGNLGNIGPAAGTINTVLKFDKDKLPSQVSVKVGKYVQKFMVNEKGQRLFRVDVTVYNTIRMRGEGKVVDEKVIKLKTPVGAPVEVIE